MLSTKNKISGFRATVWKHYRKEGRHNLPWRKTHNPYRILVSEMMLQQTQVGRVIPFYRAFLNKFGTTRRLAAASLSDVLRAWQGLGYNRRAKFLHEAAKAIVARHGTHVPRSHAELVALPGIGEYTASAIRTFAWNEPDVFLETNIRTVFIKHFFPRSHNVTDSKIIPLIEKTLDRTHPREWYYALMDYGSYLKQTEGNASRQSAHHTKQKPFKGSDREIRGAILKELSKKPRTKIKLFRALSFPRERVVQQLAALVKEGLVECKRDNVRLPG